MSRPRWALFAYHTFGARALEALLARDEQVVAVVTHADDPSEGEWFDSVAEVANVLASAGMNCEDSRQATICSTTERR